MAIGTWTNPPPGVICLKQTHTYTHLPAQIRAELLQEAATSVPLKGFQMWHRVQILHSYCKTPVSPTPQINPETLPGARRCLTVTRVRKMRTSGDTNSLKAHGTHPGGPLCFQTLVMPWEYENHTQHIALNMEAIPHPLSSYNTLLACLLVGIMISVLEIQTFQVQMWTLTILFFDVNCVCGEFLQRMRRGTVCKNLRLH